MQNIEMLNKKYYELLEKKTINDKEVRRVKKLEKEKQEVESQLAELQEQLKKEEKDVEQLNKLSLSNLYHTLKSDKDERLRQEEKEVMEVKIRLDRLSFQVEEIKAVIQQLSQGILDGGRIENEMQGILEEKKTVLMENHPQTWRKISTIEESIQKDKMLIKELGEAVRAGNIALDYIEDIMSSLKSAEGWGTFDMLGGGMLATMAKHSHMDEAQSKLHRFQSVIGNYNRELADVNRFSHIDIQIDAFLSFADYFFDGFFVDWAVQDRIHQAMDQVVSLRNRIQSYDHKMKNEIEILESRIKEKEEEITSVLIRA